MQREVAETRHVVGADKQATAKMPTARHRLHRASVEDDPGILVAEPAPGIRGAEITGLRNAHQLRKVVNGIVGSSGKNKVFTVLNRADQGGALPTATITKG